MDSSPDNFTNELAKLRDRIDGIDEQLVNLLADRLKVVKKVVDLKQAHDQPVYHPKREADLISRRRGQGEAAGLDPDFIEEIFHTMMRESRRGQTRQISALGVHSEAKVLVVGGSGAMGRCFTRWFSEAGYEVVSMGSRDWERAPELAAGADLALLSVPIDKTAEIAQRLAPHLPPTCILTDITSNKTEPMKAMMAAHSGPVIGLHPIFGPTTPTMEKQIVAITDGRDHDACQWLVDQLAAWGAVLVHSTPEEHDEAMAFVQALRHFATFTFGRFLYEKGVDLERSLDFSSPIYRLELAMVGRLFAQDAALYAEIIFATPERQVLLQDYVQSLNETLPMLKGADKSEFMAEFEKISTYFGRFSEQAMRESSYLINRLIERF